MPQQDHPIVMRCRFLPGFVLTFSMNAAFVSMQDPIRPEPDDQIVAQLTANQWSLLIYVQSLLPGDPAARDVAQQANSRIWEKRADFELGTNFRAWAFSIARYEVLNYRKQQARDARLVFSDDLEQTIATELVQASDDFQQRHEAMKSCLQKLRPQDRDLLLHRYATAGTLADFASLVERSVSGLKVTLHRLRGALLECIERRVRSGEATS